jgi:FAD/FMN-containing dehydrogenase
MNNDRPQQGQVRITRRRALQGAMGVATVASLSPVATLAEDAASASKTAASVAPPVRTLNDASRLSSTPIFRHWIARSNEELTLVERLRKELAEAKASKRPVMVSAARHSMGGQAIPRDGTAITFNINRVVADPVTQTFLVHGGTRWSEVIAALDPIGWSPAVMQSNHDFGVAATYSVNAHGWPVPYGPFGSTVKAMRIMLADGTILSCSRTENTELFNLAMGGYGLFGVILNLEVEMVENVMLQAAFETMPVDQFAPKFMRAAAARGGVTMAYGRLDVTRERFFKEAHLVTFRRAGEQPRPLPVAKTGGVVSFLSRQVYRAQLDSETAKKARWYAETVVGPKTSSGRATRNRLINEPVSNLASGDRTRTDILHEYFVSAERFAEFVRICQDIIPKSSLIDFLNVTLRYVAADSESVLSYAKTPRIAAVMSFSQPMTPEGEAEMARITSELIARIVAIDGTYYLPYRLHASKEQLGAAYPRVAEFAARKRHYDPDLLFRNALWDTYFA